MQGLRTELLLPRQARRRRLDLLRAYLKALAASSERLPYRAFRDGAPPLSAVYVQQTAVLQRGSPDQAGAPALPPRPETVLGALEHQPHLLVEGAPGTGKSSLLRHVAQTLAAHRLDHRAGRRLPVPVRVSAQELVSHPESMAASLAAAVTADLKHLLREALPPGLFAEPPLEPDSRWLVLVDAVDEVVDLDRLADLLRNERRALLGHLALWRQHGTRAGCWTRPSGMSGARSGFPTPSHGTRPGCGTNSGCCWSEVVR